MGRGYTDGLSAIILAAGANERLKGIVPSSMKPLILVNGRPLIQHAIDHANWWCASQMIVVASPENVGALIQVAPSHPLWIVQPWKGGVINAIRCAMPAVTHDRFLLLCADNTFTTGTVKKPEPLRWIGVRPDLRTEQLSRFTRLRINEDVEVHPDGRSAWIGPLQGVTSELEKALTVEDEDLTIAKVINETGPYKPLFIQCEDLGIPEAVQ